MTTSPAATAIDTESEWLETDGLGGFASGTVSGLRTRRYHALLLAARKPPTDRFVLVSGFIAWLETTGGRIQLDTQHYTPGVTTNADVEIASFVTQPWPTWRLVAANGLVVIQEIVAVHGQPTVIVSFRLESPIANVKLFIRPLLSGRDYHQLQHENPAFRFDPAHVGQSLVWQAYPDVPSVTSLANGNYRHAPDWYRKFLYTAEAERSLDCEEDLATPGILEFDLSNAEAHWILSAGTAHAPDLTAANPALYARELKARERARRAEFTSERLRSLDAYLVTRGSGRTIIAGYPWFSDWGRDTFIAIRGLCLASGRLAEAREILVEWAGAVSEGMLPNRFPDDATQTPDYNSVDASLWYVIAAHELLQRADAPLKNSDRSALERAILEIVRGYAKGTRFGIRRDTDGLLAAGVPGSQLTWMDAKIGEHVVTARVGKPVEIQALWLNALTVAALLSREFEAWLGAARNSFETRFWNERDGALFDVVDVNHEPGTTDASLRPNQIFAAGGLPFNLLSAERSARVIETVESKLLTPLGLRTLSPDNPAYIGRYTGGVWQRDTAYHQGTVWPWLMGPFVEAWVKQRGASPEAKRAARTRFLAPLLEHLQQFGIGHVSEIFDGDAPHIPRGCPFQAWSLAELVRLELQVLV